jgi:3-deoxy-D-manno-octulosonic-acid transferase
LIIVAGSTVAGTPVEEKLVLEAWEQRLKSDVKALLVIAPRHPERFAAVESLLQTCRYAKASAWGSMSEDDEDVHEPADVVLLDTIGDLAAVYGVADAAFVGGSLVERGGHNPLEPAQFGVPVVMGPSFENFRDVVARMREASGILIVQDKDELETALFDLLTNREYAKAIGEHGRQVFEQQQGATARTVEALVGMICGAKP